MTIAFLLTNLLLGAGLAMDAFTVSLANGLNDPKMRRSGAVRIAGVFAGFQAAMPLLGWFCVRTVAEHFRAFEKMIPWIALILLAAIGGKMVIEGIRCKKEPETEQTAILGRVRCCCRASQRPLTRSRSALRSRITISGTRSVPHSSSRP